MAEPIRIRAQIKGDTTDVKVLMTHPMETGQLRDPKGQLIPAHFIQTVTVTLNGKTVMEADLSQGVSTNPFLGFRFKGAKAGDKLIVAWVDNLGGQNSETAAIV